MARMLCNYSGTMLRVVVGMGMRPIAHGTHQSPRHVGQSKTQQQPASQIAAAAFEVDQSLDQQAQSDAQRADQNRAEHMAHPAGQRDQGRAAQRPSAHPAHGDERNEVIRTGQRVKPTDKRSQADEFEKCCLVHDVEGVVQYGERKLNQPDLLLVLCPT